MHRLSLSYDGSRLVARIDLGFSIGLLQLEGIKKALPMRQRQPNKVLQKVHELGHGQHCNLATCVIAKPSLLCDRLVQVSAPLRPAASTTRSDPHASLICHAYPVDLRLARPSYASNSPPAAKY